MERQPISTIATVQRKPRFRRQPEGHIQITQRDLDILRHVFRHRFLRSTHLVALLGGGQGLIRRLGVLYHHQYLDRPKEQIDFYSREGSRPMVYALGNKGADLLAQVAGVPRGKIDWTAKNRSTGPIFLDHTLLVADFMVSLEVACREHGGVRLMPSGEVIRNAPEVTRRRKNPYKWTVDVPYNGQRVTLGVIPDQIFALHYLDKPEGANKAYFFLEADRATMPIHRNDLQQTSFFRKFAAYYETWNQKIHTDTYGMKNFRVLTVTSTPERVKNLVEANKKIGSGQGSMMFLFSDERTLGEASNPLTLGWINGKDNTPVRLVG